MLPMETAYLHPKLDEVADVEEMAGEPDAHFTLRKQPRLAEDGAQVVYKSVKVERAAGKQPMARVM